MPRQNGPVSLADLAAAGVRLRPYEAVTIVRELAHQVVRGQLAGVPSAHVVRLSSTGGVSIEGPVGAGGRPVVQAAQLLDSLLPETEVTSQFRVPGGLKLVVARALGTLDLPPYGSLEAFIESLDRFAATDAPAAIANLVLSCAESVAARPPQPSEAVVPVVSAQVQPFVGARINEARALAPEPLTISDIRRARRATGVPLAMVAERSRIPIGLLRQLEWGYFYNWPAGRYGRTQLVRYARAAGLDEQLVVTTVTPLLDQADRDQTIREATAEVVSEPAALVLQPQVIDLDLVPATATMLAVPAATTPHRRRRVAFAAAAAAVVALALVPMWWVYPNGPSIPDAPQAAVSSPGRGSGSEVAPRPEAASETAAAETAPTGAADAVLSPAAHAAVGSSDVEEPAVASTGEYKLASDRTAFSPAFASVGTAIFYHEGKSGGAESALLRADTSSDGSVLKITRIVDDTANNFHVRPSPDGTRIAFDSDRDGVRGVYVADEDGQHVRRVSGEGFAAVPTWSPDSRTLAFVRGESETSPWNVWTMELESGAMRQITDRRYGQPWGGSWFPDGQRLAYSHEDRLIVHDLQTGKERVYPSPVKGRLVRTPAVSPDGRRIVFQVRNDGTWLLELPSGASRKVLDDPTAEEYTWAPDGRRLAYHSRQSRAWGVWIMTRPVNR